MKCGGSGKVTMRMENLGDYYVESYRCPGCEDCQCEDCEGERDLQPLIDHDNDCPERGVKRMPSNCMCPPIYCTTCHGTGRRVDTY